MKQHRDIEIEIHGPVGDILGHKTLDTDELSEEKNRLRTRVS